MHQAMSGLAGRAFLNTLPSLMGYCEVLNQDEPFEDF
jgi:hypothetical protein